MLQVSNNISLTNYFAVNSRFCTKVYNISMDYSFTILNLYGPYDSKMAFWDSLLSLQCIKVYKQITEGDINLILSCDEIWNLLT